MSTTTTGQAAAERTAAGDDAAVRMKDNKQEGIKNYKGFVAGVFSGIAKLTGEYPYSFSSSAPGLWND
jgi:hypothetical protein